MVLGVCKKLFILHFKTMFINKSCRKFIVTFFVKPKQNGNIWNYNARFLYNSFV